MLLRKETTAIKKRILLKRTFSASTPNSFLWMALLKPVSFANLSTHLTHLLSWPMNRDVWIGTITNLTQTPGWMNWVTAPPQGGIYDVTIDTGGHDHAPGILSAMNWGFLLAVSVQVNSVVIQTKEEEREMLSSLMLVMVEELTGKPRSQFGWHFRGVGTFWRGLGAPARKDYRIGSLSNHDDDGNKNPTNLHIWEWKTVCLHALHALHVHFSFFDIL